MSATESLMLVVLGAAIALILVILFSRAIWEAALYVMRKRRDNEVPTKIIELESERAKLMAEHASMSVKMDTTIAEVKARMAEQTAEVSRHRNRTLQLTEDVQNRDQQLEARARDIADLKSKIAELDSLSLSRAMAIKDLDQQLISSATDVRKLTSANQRLTDQLNIAAMKLRDAEREFNAVLEKVTQAAASNAGVSNVDVEGLKTRMREIAQSQVALQDIPAVIAANPPEPASSSAFAVNLPEILPAEKQQKVDDIVAAARAALQAKSIAAAETKAASLDKSRGARGKQTPAGLAAITKRLRAMQSSTGSS